MYVHVLVYCCFVMCIWNLIARVSCGGMVSVDLRPKTKFLEHDVIFRAVEPLRVSHPIDGGHFFAGNRPSTRRYTYKRVVVFQIKTRIGYEIKPTAGYTKSRSHSGLLLTMSLVCSLNIASSCDKL